MARIHQGLFVVGLLSLAGSASSALAQASFIPLGFIGGTNRESYAWGISADGLTVVGEASSPAAALQTEAFKWTQAGGKAALGTLNPANVSSVANAVNADGSVVVGYSRYNNIGTLFEAFRDTNGTIEPGDALGDLVGGSFLSNATAVNPNGSVVVGYGTVADAQGTSRRHAFFNNTANGVFIDLGLLTGDNVAVAYGVATIQAANGSLVSATVVGQSGTSTSTRAIRWTVAPDGTNFKTQLADLPGGAVFAEAWGISSDGLVIVGDSSSANGLEAVKWIGGVALPLGDLPGGDFNSSALAASADGSIIVGYGTSATSGFLGEAVYWDAQGIHSVRDVLAAAGANITGWDFQIANAVSADGTRIVGNGTNPSGAPEAWMLILGGPASCPADFNGDGTVDPDDLSDFITGFFSVPSDPRTDFSGDGIVDPDDLSDFITAFFGPCP